MGKIPDISGKSSDLSNVIVTSEYLTTVGIAYSFPWAKSNVNWHAIRMSHIGGNPASARDHLT
jgi:hypothetical protein